MIIKDRHTTRFLSEQHSNKQVFNFRSESSLTALQHDLFCMCCVYRRSSCRRFCRERTQHSTPPPCSILRCTTAFTRAKFCSFFFWKNTLETQKSCGKGFNMHYKVILKDDYLKRKIWFRLYNVERQLIPSTNFFLFPSAVDLISTYRKKDFKKAHSVFTVYIKQSNWLTDSNCCPTQRNGVELLHHFYTKLYWNLLL